MSLSEWGFSFRDLYGQKVGEKLILTTCMLAIFLFLDFRNVKISPFCSYPSLSNDISYYSLHSNQNTLFFCHLPKHIIGISSLVSLLILFHSPIFPICLSAVNFTRYSSRIICIITSLLKLKPIFLWTDGKC